MIIGKIYSYLKIQLLPDVGLRRTCQIFLIVTRWSYSKSKEVLHTLNVHKLSGREHMVVFPWATNEMLVLEILFWKFLKYVPLLLTNYKK